MLDLLITGGVLQDGTGSPPRRADIGITGDTITAVGDLSAAPATCRLPLVTPSTLPSSPDTRHATPSPHPHTPTLPHPLFLSPGFIDVHSHSDTYLLIEPSAPSKITQGITTEVAGNCGASAAPLFSRSDLPSDWADKDYPGEWRSVAEYRALLEEVTPAPNLALLIGHNTLRRGVAGCENRALSADEMARMIRLLEQGLDEGGRGLSTGLIYAPGRFAPAAELTALAGVAARRGGIYASHMRSETAWVVEAVDEALGIGRQAGCRVEISHLKTAGRANWSRLDDVLERIRAARSEGLCVGADRYPYTAGCTELDVVFPDWAAAGGREAVLARLRAPADRKRLRKDLVAARSEEAWSEIVVGSTSHPDNAQFRGKPLPEVAAELGGDVVDAILHLTDTDELKTTAFFPGMSEANMRRILLEPYVMLGTDASLRATSGVLSGDHPHPRAYGSFPRFLRMALDEELMPLPEAVRRLTSLPADHFALKKRGRIAKGYKADIVVFDPAVVGDRATYAEPHALSAGIVHVFVNGVHTLAEGKLTGKRGGHFL